MFKRILSKYHSEEIVEQIVNKFFYTDIHHSSIIIPEELTFLENLNIID